MPSWPKLKNAPIQEAILSIGFDHSSEVSFDSYNKIVAKLSDKYPISTKKFKVKLKGKFENDIHNVESNQTQDGIVLKSTDKKVIQLGLNSISFHLIESYTSWENFRDDFKYILVNFTELFPNLKVKALSVRYLNNIQLPIEFLNGFQDYLTLLPGLPEGVTSLSGFLTQITTPLDNQTHATINESLKPIGLNELPSVLLDIVVIKQVQEGEEIREIWEELEKLREHKNKLFYGSLTPKTIDLYER